MTVEQTYEQLYQATFTLRSVFGTDRLDDIAGWEDTINVLQDIDVAFHADAQAVIRQFFASEMIVLAPATARTHIYLSPMIAKALHNAAMTGRWHQPYQISATSVY